VARATRPNPAGREAIAQAALATLDDVGLDRLTIRRVAERLGVHPSALYWHFKDKQDLVDYLAEALLGDHLDGYAEPDPGVPWQQWLASLAASIRTALLSRRDGPRLFAGATPADGPLLPTINATLGMLLDAGFDIAGAAYGANTIVNFTIGFALEEQTVHLRANGLGDGAERLARMRAAGSYPNLVRAAVVTGTGDFDAEFSHGVALIIAGMQTIQPPPADPVSGSEL
jgi:TetR/AcrR family transcriptional regulator, tetracycline repressor protein